MFGLVKSGGGSRHSAVFGIRAPCDTAIEILQMLQMLSRCYLAYRLGKLIDELAGNFKIT